MCCLVLFRGTVPINVQWEPWKTQNKTKTIYLTLYLRTVIVLWKNICLLWVWSSNTYLRAWDRGRFLPPVASPPLLTLCKRLGTEEASRWSIKHEILSHSCLYFLFRMCQMFPVGDGLQAGQCNTRTLLRLAFVTRVVMLNAVWNCLAETSKAFPEKA